MNMTTSNPATQHLNHITADFIIIGAGVIGLNIARELKRRHPDAHIIILEKEKQIGEHASGRNSGVLHAGFYYTKDSLKAKFTKNGNQALTAYCLDKKIPINRCGKLVVTRNADELPGLHELLERGRQNNIPLDLISAEEAKAIEPRVKTFQQALFSPTTASVDPRTVLQHILQDAIAEGIQVVFEAKYLRRNKNTLYTSKGPYEAGYIINAAGLYADVIAKDFGFSTDYTILPFKGLYLYASNPAEKLRTNIYPVPDLQNPFLGVHFTLTVDGKVKIGPTAIPAFWREHYDGLSGFNLSETIDIISREMGLFIKAGFDFRRLAMEEIKKYSRRVLTNHAAALASDIHKDNYQTWGKPGIRAQLLNIKTRKLEMDFIFEGDDKSMHVLNAVSPAFTCSIPFASYVVDAIQAKVS
jgi:L-2-hydroxyglutarate oxidase